MALTNLPIIPVILAGGAGKRLYPISTPECPKPFVCLPNGQTLLHETLRRCAIQNVSQMIVVAAERYAGLAQQEIKSACFEKNVQVHLLLEEAPHNTGAAVAFAVHYARANIHKNACLFIMPADQWIEQNNAFTIMFHQAATIAISHQKMLVFGVPPTHASTQYGYIHAGKNLFENEHVCEVEAFVEKPDAATAECYLANGNYWWNAGMVCASATVLYRQLKQYAPEIFEAVEATPIVLSPNANVILQNQAWRNVEALSLDYALLEKTNDLWVMQTPDFGWSDMGTPEAFEQLSRMRL